jgi:hypothetical protein
MLVEDLRLDRAPCGALWVSLQLHGPARTEYVRARPRREVWLRRSGDHVRAEVITDGHPKITIEPLTRLVWRTKAAAPAAAEGDPVLVVEHAGETRSLALPDLKHKYRAENATSGAEISLCALADDLGERPKAIAVVGEDGEAPQMFTIDECRERGLILHASQKGEFRLRSADGDRLLRIVRRIRL